MAHEAMIAGRNAALTATLDPEGWDPAASVDLLAEPDGVRARSIGAGVEGAPRVLRGRWDEPELCSFAGLYDTNLDQTDTHELLIYANGDYSELAWTSGRVAVIEPLFDPADLPFEDPRKFSGGLYPEAWRSWPANVYLFPPSIYGLSFEWRMWSAGLTPTGTAAGYVEVDHLWLGDGVFFDLQIDSTVDDDTGVSTRREAGRVIAEPGTAGRTATLPLASVEPGLIDQIVTIVRSGRGLSPIAWIPDRDDPAACFLYGFLARITKAGRRWGAGGWADSTLNLEEFS
ncbi:hypothetical protein [Roseomonas genomospecies 6]|uniref:Uncharacterized protein n=1 Tax=Roseomonas genomospecies 6 TaxID=214106 RepID=A0A9W7KQY8_9PROT|nr:hypothetical protein [Roseomonas genomospecies 6]KAA0678069.1 hypothetical protein DS843_21030 [Roseomonas genomospecies 6]